MSAGNYKRATKRYPAIVDHVDGDVSKGYVLVPIGSDFMTTIMQASGFLTFEMEDGKETYLNLSAVKRVTEIISDADKNRREQEARQAEQAKAKADKEAKANKQTVEKEKTADTKATGQRVSPFSRNEEYEALDILGLGEYATFMEIQGTYRRLVKLYHPDRLRGLGVSDKKIAYAAERLAEINNAYKLLAKVVKAA